MKSKTVKTSRKTRKQPGKFKRAVGEQSVGCAYTTTWSPVETTRGMTQVWVSTKIYDKVGSPYQECKTSLCEKPATATLGADRSRTYLRR